MWAMLGLILFRLGVSRSYSRRSRVTLSSSCVAAVTPALKFRVKISSTPSSRTSHWDSWLSLQFSTKQVRTSVASILTLAGVDTPLRQLTSFESRYVYLRKCQWICCHALWSKHW